MIKTRRVYPTKNRKTSSWVPGNRLIANKTGELNGIENDAAIIYGTNTDYILVIMSDGVSDSGSAVNTIRYISSLTWQYLNP